MAKNKLAADIKEIKNHLIEKEPTHFDAEHIFKAFFGAILVGLTFTLKGLLFQVSQAFTNQEIALLIAATIVILTAEIYLVGYKRVKNKKTRKFGQFWLKRLFSYYLIGILVAIGLVYIYGLHNFAVTPYHAIKMVIAVSMPAAIGAAAADLFEKY
ncbi:DUF2391 family protein [Candidatus Woesearchaeota archaeon]|nr:DUF2391 family protein [Candidatus Woesearchaeota archaeon]